MLFSWSAIELLKEIAFNFIEYHCCGRRFHFINFTIEEDEDESKQKTKIVFNLYMKASVLIWTTISLHVNDKICKSVCDFQFN